MKKYTFKNQKIEIKKIIIDEENYKVIQLLNDKVINIKMYHIENTQYNQIEKEQDLKYFKISIKQHIKYLNNTLTIQRLQSFKNEILTKI